MNRLRVLITDGLNTTGLDLLKTHPELDLSVRESTTTEELKKLVPGFDVLLIRSKTQVTRALILESPRLKVIVSCGTGTDQIDEVAAKEAGIEVFNCPTANSLSTAEHTLGLIFSITRHIAHAHHLLQSGKWERGLSMRGTEIHGKVLGIIGMGNIGRIVAEKAMALGMQVIAYDVRSAFELKLPAKFKFLENRYTLAQSIPDVLKHADILTLHIPKIEKNLSLISKNEISQMRPGGFLINCARGGIVDENAVVEALNAGHLRGAAFDVFEKEPADFTRPIFSHPKIVVTAHIGGNTDEALDRIGVQAAQRLLEFVNRQP